MINARARSLLRGVAAAAALWVLSAPLAAAQSAATMREPAWAAATISDCLSAVESERAAGGTADPYRCVGAAVERCYAAEENFTTMGAIACADASRRAWDDRLNEAYLTARSELPAGAADALQKAQRAWIGYRDESCGVWRAVFEGGSLGGQIAADCLAETTGRRAIEMTEFVGLP